MTDAELYARGAKTLLASWEEDARGASGASVERLPGVAAAVFPSGPERAVYNNALLERDLDAAERARAIEAMEAAYAGAGVTRFAAWVHESHAPMRADFERRGYVLDEYTRMMGMELGDVRLPEPEVELAAPDWSEYLRILGVGPDFQARADRSAYHVLVARLDGENVATAVAFDCDGDCGIYNVGALEHARRRGLATGLTALLLRDAMAGGCRTASIQSTEMAEGLYAALGFRDLGRFLEFAPPAGEIRIEQHAGPRDELRPLFELAEDSPAQLSSYLDSGQVLVAVADDEIVGHLQLTKTDRPAEIEIKNMAVLPGQRRRGIGRTLIAAAVELAGRQSRSTIRVATATADVDNLSFYQRAGFRTRSIERDVFTAADGYGPRVDVDRVWLDRDVDARDGSAEPLRPPAAASRPVASAWDSLPPRWCEWRPESH